MVVIKSGLMLPTEEKYYSSEEMIREWADNGRHPDIEEMIDFCDYSLNHTVQTMFAHNLVMGKISEIFEDEIAPVWEGTATAQELSLIHILTAAVRCATIMTTLCMS